MQQRPPSLLGAAAVQAADALIVAAGSVLAGVDTIAGRSYQTGSGIAPRALAWPQPPRWPGWPWGSPGPPVERTPAALTQLFVGIVGIYLVQGHQYAWGVAALLLACAGLALLLAPASLRALARPARRRPAPQPPPRAKAAAG